VVFANASENAWRGSRFPFPAEKNRDVPTSLWVISTFQRAVH